ncbi:MAG TPA: M48 family metallopeptidase [Candidatus Paceibacterota bacterium]|nr:M48 family metallopeptidase [Candidatus Paceibacterota bacterium]
MPPSLYTQQSKNVWRTWLLMSIFFVIVIALGWIFAYTYDDVSILYIAVFIALVMNIFSYWYSDKIALKTSGAKQITKEQYPDYWNAIENLCITAGLPMPRLYVIQDPAPNAFATGRNKEHAAIAATSGLLAMMNKSELEGVLAHELSHIGNRDILLSTIVVVLVGFIALLANFFIRLRLFGGGGRRNDGGLGIIFLIVGIVFAILSPIAATLIQLAISRKREYLADASGALLTRYPEGLASALEKIGNYNQPMIHPNNATAHLFISNPFGPHKDKMSGLSRLFMTHPPIQDRINALLGTKA